MGDTYGTTYAAIPDYHAASESYAPLYYGAVAPFHLEDVATDAEGIVVSWPNYGPRYRYQLEGTSSLTSNNFVVVAPYSTNGPSAQTSWTNTTPAGAAFFRGILSEVE